MELRGLGHLNHDSHGALIRHDRPHRIRPEDRMRLGMFLFRVAFGLSGAKNAIEQRHAFVLVRQHFAERFSDEFVCGSIDQAAKGGIDEAHDVTGSLGRDHRQRRMLEDGEAEARQIGGLMQCVRC